MGLVKMKLSIITSLICLTLTSCICKYDSHESAKYWRQIDQWELFFIGQEGDSVLVEYSQATSEIGVNKIINTKIPTGSFIKKHQVWSQFYKRDLFGICSNPTIGEILLRDFAPLGGAYLKISPISHSGKDIWVASLAKKDSIEYPTLNNITLWKYHKSLVYDLLHSVEQHNLLEKGFKDHTFHNGGYFYTDGHNGTRDYLENPSSNLSSVFFRRISPKDGVWKATRDKRFVRNKWFTFDEENPFK